MRNYKIKRVDDFAQSMIVKLEKNDYKGDWMNESFTDLYTGLICEVAELQEAIFDPKKTKEDVIDECVDVANFAMFLAQKIK